jgi:hypothetical protein
MGLQFLDSETRNPTNQAPEQPPVDHCDELQQFIDENNLLQKFYVWQGLRDEFNKKKEIEAQGGFEEIE